MPGMTRNELRSYATLGASKRLAELMQERETIEKAFPELRNGAQHTLNSEEPKRYRMSRAAKKAVSARMKAYWATRRAAKTPHTEAGHRYPKRKPRLLNKEGRVVAGS